jgi:hypothetical protein
MELMVGMNLLHGNTLSMTRLVLADRFVVNSREESVCRLA